jgi:hypothetical protein
MSVRIVKNFKTKKMKKLLSLFVAVVIVFSCDEDSIYEKCLLTRIENNSEGFQVDVLYNEELQIQSILGTSDQDGFTREIQFNYESNLIESISIIENGVEMTEYDLNVQYESGLISKLIATNGLEIDEKRFFYENGRVVKIEDWENYYKGTTENF